MKIALANEYASFRCVARILPPAALNSALPSVVDNRFLDGSEYRPVAADRHFVPQTERR